VVTQSKTWESAGPSGTTRILALGPIFILILAATAIPIELRPPGSKSISFGVGILDVIINILLYLPLGIALAKRELTTVVLTAVVLSGAAESAQLIAMHRTPSLIDVFTNSTGATMGVLLARRWRLECPSLATGRWRALVAATLAASLLLGVWLTTIPLPSKRGASAPGILETHLNFDEPNGRHALDSSGHRLDGRLRNGAARGSGKRAGAVHLDGAGAYVDLGRTTALRLSGSMTICAWINASAFPVDDAAHCLEPQHSRRIGSWLSVGHHD
jgi:VanZ like family